MAVPPIALPAAQGAAFSLHQLLGSLVRRAPVTCTPATPLRQAVERMLREHIGAVVVAGADMVPVGIVTADQVLASAVLGERSIEATVESLMRTDLLRFPPEATAQEALLAMARHLVRHVLVIDRAGRLAGVVSRGDVYATQQLVPHEIMAPLLAARSSSELADAAAAARRFAKQLLARGLGADLVIEWTTSLNDFVTVQAIELMKARFPLPDMRWCWMAFGSEGRLEQTLSTTQNNGIIFDTMDGGGHAIDAGAMRGQFLPFAQAVNQLLDECGFPLGRGQSMAGEPQCCLSAAEWRARFEDWTRATEPKKLAGAGKHFDLRRLYGPPDLVEDLQRAMLAGVREQTAFFKLLADEATSTTPPLGTVRTFVVDRKSAVPNTVDLKLSGVRPFVDAVRVLALSNGCAPSGTVARVQALVGCGVMSSEEASAAIAAFKFLQGLRLRNQQEHGGNAAAANRLNPYKLDRLERQLLRHAFMQVRLLQQRVKAQAKG